MRKVKTFAYFLPVLIIAIISLALHKAPAYTNPGQPHSPEEQTKAIVFAANAFLNTLTKDQLKTTRFEFLRPTTAGATQFDMSKMRAGPGGPNGRPTAAGDTVHRPRNGNKPDNSGNKPSGGPPASGEQYGKAVWSNFPVSITTRPGIELGKLNTKQRAAATHLLTLMLSANGYQKIQDIMGSDEALAKGGTDFIAGADHYLIAIFGKPDETKPWMVEFGGHHLGLNVVIAGEHGALTPTLTGAQPAIYTANGRVVRVLAHESDMAFDLLNSLSDSERNKALLNYHIGDLVLGPGHDGQTIVPEGLKASAMTSGQKQLLLKLITEWAGIINDAYQNDRVAEIKAQLDETYFAWSGPTTHEENKNGSAYYRVQGPRVIIEFSPQATFGDMTMHVHTIYRDPGNEYGGAYPTQ